MPRFVKEGLHPIETSVPREAAELRSQGWKEHAAKTAAVKEADASKADSK